MALHRGDRGRWLRAAGYVLPVAAGSALSALVAWRLARQATAGAPTDEAASHQAAPAGTPAPGTPTSGIPVPGTPAPETPSHPVPVVPAPRRAERDRWERSQADQVSTMWGNISADGGDTEPGLWGALLSNDSDAPIRFANLTVRHRRDGWVSKGGFHKVAPHCRLKWSAVKVYAGAGGGFGPTAFGSGRINARRAWRDPTMFTVELTFQDASNRFWFIGDDDEKVELDRNLVIWLDDERVNTCDTHISNEFQPKFGVSAQFERFATAEDLQRTLNAYAEGVRSGRAAPDVIVGAHDWLGRLDAEGAIAEVSLTTHQRDSFEAKALQPLIFGNRLMGVPYSFDTVALIANRDLVGDTPPPRTLDELLQSGARLSRPGGRAVALHAGPGGDMYHAWPIFSSVGGTMAGLRADGGYDPPQVWRAGLTEAFEALVDLRGRAPLLFDLSLTRSDAVELFLQGRTPYFISACGNLGELLERGMRLQTSAVPPLGRYPARTLVTVMTFYLSTFGRNRRVAQDLLTYYLARPDTGVELNRTRPWPPVQREAVEAVAYLHPELHGFGEAVAQGIVMPSHPQMRHAWDHLFRGQVRVARGDRDAEAIARDVADGLGALDLQQVP